MLPTNCPSGYHTARRGCDFSCAGSSSCFSLYNAEDCEPNCGASYFMCINTLGEGCATGYRIQSMSSTSQCANQSGSLSGASQTCELI